MTQCDDTLKTLSQVLRIQTLCFHSRGHPKGPVGLYELSFQHWSGQALQKGFLHDCKNRVWAWRPPKTAGPGPQLRETRWNTPQPSASLERETHAGGPGLTNTPAFLRTSQWFSAPNPLPPLCSNPCWFCSSGGIEVLCRYRRSHTAVSPRHSALRRSAFLPTPPRCLTGVAEQFALLPDLYLLSSLPLWTY